MFEFFQNMGFFASLKDKFDDLMDDMQQRMELAIEKAIKRFIMLVLMFMGIIFSLVGLSKYLSETIPNLSNGLGFVVVGLALLFLGILTKLLSTN